MKKAFGILTSLLLAGSLIGQPASAATDDSAEKPQLSKAPFDIKGFISESEPNNEFKDARETGIDYIAAGR